MVPGHHGGDALMLGVQMAALAEIPTAVPDAVAVVAGIDTALVNGFGRLGDQDGAALAAMAGAVSGSPLGAAVADAAAKLGAGSIGPEELSAVAAGRAALLGAVHDALAERFDSALGRTRSAWEGSDEPARPDDLVVGCRSWLQEVAITGWRGVDHDLVAAADRTVAALWAEPTLRRPAVLLDGFTAELRAACPIATLDKLPTRRWADLWTRALLSTWRCADIPHAATVSGRLLILGVDVHEHGTAVQAQIHGVLETGDGLTRRVRVSVGAAKVDTIVGPAIWELLADHRQLLRALAEHRALAVTDLPLTASGDLLWRDDRAELDAPADPFTTARVRLADAVGPAAPPLERDPVHLAEPVLLEGYRVRDGAVELDGHRLAVDVERLPGCGPLTPSAVTSSSACIGLVRWDAGRWMLRPLAVRRMVKGAPVDAHNGDWALGPTDPKVVKALAKSGDSVAVLRERAGRLLRK
ncbi:hypothetical protein [Nocardia sp. NPDC005366]|uniref:hypothetical protein n=1 Tax=Nocardia sp. NPDC005366 TaxID=3156878 RepID=UPI0033A09D5C